MYIELDDEDIKLLIQKRFEIEDLGDIDCLVDQNDKKTYGFEAESSAYFNHGELKPTKKS